LLIRQGQLNGLTAFYRLLNVLKEKFMVSLFDPENIMTVILLKVLNMRRIGAERILVDNNFQVRMILTEVILLSRRYVIMRCLKGQSLSAGGTTHARHLLCSFSSCLCVLGALRG